MFESAVVVGEFGDGLFGIGGEFGLYFSDGGGVGVEVAFVYEERDGSCLCECPGSVFPSGKRVGVSWWGSEVLLDCAVFEVGFDFAVRATVCL